MTVEVSVAGVRYSGWQRGSLQLTMSELANSFELEYVAGGKRVADRALYPGDAVAVRIDGHDVIRGHVDTTDDEDAAEDLRLRVAGRSATADLVDCSAVKQSFGRQTALGIAQAVAKPFGIVVRAESDVGEPFPVFSVQQGETCADVILRAAQPRGLYPYAVGGELVLGRAGATRTATRLVRGQYPLLRTARSDSWYSRYSEYVFRGQVRGTDDRHGRAASQLKSSVTDPEITRYRPLLIQVEARGQGDLVTRAEVARNQRIGQGHTVRCVLLGLTTAEGTPWRPNMLVDLDNPALDLRETMLTSVVRMRFGEGDAEETELELVPPIAFDVGKNRAAVEKGRKRGFYTKP